MPARVAWTERPRGSMRQTSPEVTRSSTPPPSSTSRQSPVALSSIAGTPLDSATRMIRPDAIGSQQTAGHAGPRPG